MSKIIQIGIHKTKGDVVNSINTVEAIKGKGLVNNWHFKENNEKRCQITLIEIENINQYNKITKTKIQPVNFRRNIVTSGVRLNELLKKEFFVGKVRLKAHDLCRPCKYLQDLLKQNNIIKEFLDKGGIRCEILSSGKISVGDKIIF